MALTVPVPGKATISIDGTAFAITRNGIAYAERPFFSDVFSDTHGGDSGPPIDRQYLGMIADIRIICVEWDKALLSEILSNLQGGTGGSVPVGDIGALLIAASKYFQLSWACATDNSFNRTFSRAVPSAEPKEVPVGTKNSELVLAWEGWRNISTGYVWQ